MKRDDGGCGHHRILNSGAGVVQFNNFSMVAALATPAQLISISALPGLEGVYANKQLQYFMLHESVTGDPRRRGARRGASPARAIGIAILDSGIDGLYNPDLTYPTIPFKSKSW